jgi:hypothetical protein
MFEAFLRHGVDGGTSTAADAPHDLREAVLQ